MTFFGNFKTERKCTGRLDKTCLIVDTKFCLWLQRTQLFKETSMETIYGYWPQENQQLKGRDRVSKNMTRSMKNITRSLEDQDLIPWFK